MSRFHSTAVSLETMGLSYHILWNGLRTSVVLAVVACAMPQRAPASCGDYITIQHTASASERHQVHFDTMDGEPSTPARTPCQGPNCSNSPTDELPLAPVVPVSPQLKEQAEFLAKVWDGECPSSGFDRESSSSRPVYRTNSIFHPPRLG